MVAPGEDRGRGGIVREFGTDMYTLLYLKWITNKVLPYSTRNSAQCYVAAWMGRSLGENGDTCICMAEPLCCPPETIITLLISYASIQNKKFYKSMLFWFIGYLFILFIIYFYEQKSILRYEIYQYSSL